MNVFVSAFREVFQRRGYLWLLGVLSISTILLTTILIQWANLVNVASAATLPISAKLHLMGLLLIHPGARADLFTLSMAYAIAIAVSLSLTLNIYAVRELRMEKSWIGQVSGVLLGSLGFGCAACGTFVLSGVLSTAVTATVVSFLPFHGREFLVAGVFLLGLSVYRTAKSIDKKVCDVVRVKA